MEPSPKILVADDEQINLELMEAILSKLGYGVLLASDGNQALSLALDRMPDLILLDIVMPGLDGFEVTGKLKENDRTKIIPIVIVSGKSEVRDRVKALEVGADDFLNKPVDPTELKARICSLLKVKAYNDHMVNYQKKLEEEVAKRTLQLKASLDKIKSASLEAIYRLSLAAEYKNKETGDHIKRVSHYAEAIAQKMGLNKATIEAILYATPMHDVGKIGIPDHILLKPGKHDEKEWEIMKQHTTIGARIMDGSEYGFIRLASVIAMTHHERWDGGGYPRGLKGKKIPLAGRIAALADFFDAMISERPYRNGIHSIEHTIETIKENSGSHFDPQVVDCFVQSQERICRIKETFSQN
ncbi:MAG: response regulator [Candidatus Edwardsbacteria bacterium]|nr:response regulator [Candidatus Edwardsbacteria bacterium]MBU1577050.1 response regulator [Candidatus Edwardsbacteria bacterium]MBU2464190.1 response regulator [Candidatus Edwardsbacteria bacterium]MBU2593792.1 response regulator [Candidatus Edwardsbacteria bacterium]